MSTRTTAARQIWHKNVPADLLPLHATLSRQKTKIPLRRSLSHSANGLSVSMKRSAMKPMPSMRSLWKKRGSGLHPVLPNLSPRTKRFRLSFLTRKNRRSLLSRNLSSSKRPSRLLLLNHSLSRCHPSLSSPRWCLLPNRSSRT